MASIGDEGIGVRSASDSGQVKAEDCVCDRRDCEKCEADIETMDLRPRDQLADALHEYQEGRKGDCGALESGGHELDLAMAVRMREVGRPCSDREGEIEHSGADDVDGRLHRIRKDGGRASQGVRRKFGQKDQDADEQRRATRPHASGLHRPHLFRSSGLVLGLSGRGRIHHGTRIGPLERRVNSVRIIRAALRRARHDRGRSRTEIDRGP